MANWLIVAPSPSAMGMSWRTLAICCCPFSLSTFSRTHS